MKKLAELENLEKFYIDAPLYLPYEGKEREVFDFLYKAVSFRGKIDTYCIECHKHSTYEGEENNISNNLLMTSQGRLVNVDELFYNTLKFQDINSQETKQGGQTYFLNKVWVVNFQCTRVNTHKMFIVLHATNTSVAKIGQYPSIADTSSYDIKKYQKVLANDYKDFSKAVGLVSHGIGVGSFVYLRRIFENLIEEAHGAEKTNAAWNEDTYNNSRMADKIALLKHQLPDFLVENKALYSIISKGIHELSEEECLDAFPLIKASIELILDQKLAKKEAERKEKDVRAAIAALSKRMSQG